MIYGAAKAHSTVALIDSVKRRVTPLPPLPFDGYLDTSSVVATSNYVLLSAKVCPVPVSMGEGGPECVQAERTEVALNVGGSGRWRSIDIPDLPAGQAPEIASVVDGRAVIYLAPVGPEQAGQAWSITLSSTPSASRRPPVASPLGCFVAGSPFMTFDRIAGATIAHYTTVDDTKERSATLPTGVSQQLTSLDSLLTCYSAGDVIGYLDSPARYGSNDRYRLHLLRLSSGQIQDYLGTGAPSSIASAPTFIAVADGAGLTILGPHGQVTLRSAAAGPSRTQAVAGALLIYSGSEASPVLQVVDLS